MGAIKPKREVRGAEAPRTCASCAVQHVQHETDALADSDEADHGRHDHRQQAENLLENPRNHIRGYNGCQLKASAYYFLRSNPLSKIK